MRKIGLWLFFAAVLGTTPALAQADALVQASRNCSDGQVPLEKRLANCNLVVNAKGLEPEEMAIAYIDLGVVYQEQHDSDAALSAFNKALSIQPDLWQGLIDRAFLYLNKGEIDLAVADYKAVSATDPDAAVINLPNVGEYRPVVNGTVHNYDSPERDRGARTDSVSMLRSAVTAALSQRCRARAAAPNGLDSALADCNAAVAITPDSPIALSSRGFVEFLRADYRSAVSDLKAAPSGFPVPLYLRGVANHRLGNGAEGDADIAAAEKLKPGITAELTAQGVAP